jgi:uncharacterized protein (TIGR00369 family)
MEFLQAILAGQFPPPPIASLLNFALVEVTAGRAVFATEPAEYHYNPIGSVHGGIAATLLDSAMGCAVHSTLPAGASYTTIELHINYIRPMTTDTGRIRAVGEVIHVGRRQAIAQGWLRGEDEKLYGHATTTCLIFSAT